MLTEVTRRSNLESKTDNGLEGLGRRARVVQMNEPAPVDRANAKHALLLFAILCIVFSAVAQYLSYLGGGVNKAPFTTILVMWSPGIAALIAALAARRTLRGFGWRLGPTKYIGIAYALPFLYALPMYVLVWASGIGTFDERPLVTAARKQLPPLLGNPLGIALVLGTAGVAISMLSALGEEIGWRGFLTIEIHQRFDYVKTSLLIGIIWAVWHWPLILWCGYDAGKTPIWFALTCFTVATVGETFAYTYLRLRSASLWPAVVLHGSHNLFIQAVFDPLTTDGPRTRWFTTEFGILGAISGVVLAVVFTLLARRNSASATKLVGDSLGSAEPESFAN